MKPIHHNRTIYLGIAAALSALTLPIFPVQSQESLDDWWTGTSATGGWLGARPAMENYGVKIFGWWQGTFYGVTGGGLDQRGAFDEEFWLFAKLDFEKMLGFPGLSYTGSVRWRDGTDPNEYVGASPIFNPSHFQAGKQWRLMPQFLTWQSGNLLGPENLLTISGGWQNPMLHFAVQPDSKFFMNNAIFQIKGIGANGIPFNGAYEAWGGFLNVKPDDLFYAQAGLYLAIPEGSSTANHGLSFEGANPASSNGLYALAEVGSTPKFGDSKLPGKYVAGGIYYGEENTSFLSGEVSDERYTFYFQADQMLYREPSPTPTPTFGKGVADGKSFANPKDSKAFEEPNTPKLSEQGLYAIGFVNFAPKYNNLLPFYFHAGLLYRGPLPTRDNDTIGTAFMYGQFSSDRILARREAGLGLQKTYEAVVEIDYRFAVNDFIAIQPFWQYVIRPNATGTIQNANVLGVSARVSF